MLKSTTTDSGNFTKRGFEIDIKLSTTGQPETSPFKPVVPKLRPAGRIRPTKNFYPARRALFKNIYTHFESQLDRIMSGIPQFQFFYVFMSLENTPRFWEKNSEIRDESK